MGNPALLKEQDHIKEAFIQRFQPAYANGNLLGSTIREKAKKSLEQLDFPTRKTEAWKYTRIKPLLTSTYTLGQSFSISNVDEYLIPGLAADVLVFLNGVYAPELSRIKLNEGHLHISPLSALTGTHAQSFEEQFGSIIDPHLDIFTAINTAFAKSGWWIQVPKGTVLPAPIQVLHLSKGGDQPISMNLRNVIQVESGAQAQMVETYHSLDEAPTLRLSGTEIWVEPQGRLDLVRMQQEGHNASTIDYTTAQLSRDCHFGIHTYTLGGEIVRNNLRLSLEGKQIEAYLMGAYLLTGNTHVDNHTQVDHRMAHCMSNELYKGIMDDQSTGVFSGRINVFPDAQKTNAYQSNRNLLLTDTANIFTQPQLEIYADDVKCSHGATTGRLEEDAMFYLRARGIKEEEARKLLIHAFVGEVIEYLPMEEVRSYIEERIAQSF